MKRYIYIFSLLSLFIGCTNYDFIETGLSHNDSSQTMYEYFEKDPYNFDSLLVMINYAELDTIFKGESTYGNKLTFFALTNHGINAYLFSKDYTSVKELSVEECRTILLSLLVAEPILREELPWGSPSTNTEESIIGKGGKIFKTLNDKPLWIYSRKSSFNDVPDVGPTEIRLVSPLTQKNTHVQTTDLIKKNGVIQVLPYDVRPFDF